MNEAQPFGAATHYLLSELAPLMLPRKPDAWGYLRPQATMSYLRLSAELAHTAYTMDVVPWLAAGWRDVTIQVDGELTEGVTEGKNLLERMANAWKMRRVKAKIQGKNPFGQMLGTVRQLKSSDTGKAVVMLHPLPDGRYAVAIGFMGTGGRMYDWISNFRMTADNGIHKGFWQLGLQFEGNEEAITFPETARELGLERLTLADILKECRHENSRFLIWMAGHSQGGAVMQVWTYLKMQEDGVLPGNMMGCGFASPRVCSGTALRYAAAYPLAHVVNTDDVVPRMGAMTHLGEVLIYAATDKLRRECYARPADVEARHRQTQAQPILDIMRDTPACLTLCAAYLSLLEEHPVEEVLGGLSWLASDLRLARKVAEMADDKADSLLRHLQRKCVYAYESITGMPMNPRRVKLMKQKLQSIADRIGIRALSDTLLQLMAGPHSLRPRTGADQGAYPYIARNGAADLVEARWLSGQRPALLRSDNQMPLVCTHIAHAARRKPKAPHQRAQRKR